MVTDACVCRRDWSVFGVMPHMHLCVLRHDSWDVSKANKSLQLTEVLLLRDRWGYRAWRPGWTSSSLGAGGA